MPGKSFLARLRGRSEPETRSTSGYTSLINDALLSAAEGSMLATALATAALESCAGLYARAFAAAQASPAGARTRALTPSTLAWIGRELIREGEAVGEILVRDGGVHLRRCAHWDIQSGTVDPESWRIRVSAYGPSATTTKTIPWSGVVHPMYGIYPDRPWLGVSPLGFARATGALAGNLEGRTAAEAKTPSGYVLPLPAPPPPDDEDEPDPMAPVRAALGKGGLHTVETTAHGFGEGAAAAPAQDWVQRRYGFDIPEDVRELRLDVFRGVAAACLVPPELVTGEAMGTARREALRQFLHVGVQPLARIVEEELSAKLETDVALSFDRLQAADTASKARAVQSFVNAEVPLDRALALAGIEAETAA